MKNTKFNALKPMLLMLAIIGLFLSLCSVSLADDSGTLGNLDWTLDDNGTLTISGTGKMEDLDSIYNEEWLIWVNYIKKVIISEGITSIGRDAFFRCRYMTSVSIPNSVTSIGSNSFGFCVSLKTIHIPSNVTAIGEGAIAYCSGLENITIGSGNPSYTIQNGILFDKNKSTLILYPAKKAGTSYTVPDSVTKIANEAFSSCKNLKSITIPSSVKTVGGGAFWGCENLSSITLPNSITEISSSLFQYCSSLKTISIPSTIKKIGTNAFEGTALTSFNIPSGITRIEGGTFHDCSELKSVTIPKSVTSIGTEAFSGCTKLSSIVIPNSVIGIDEYAFLYCDNLKTITIPDSVIYISENAFEGCSDQLTMIVEPDSYALKYAKQNNIRYRIAGQDLIPVSKISLNKEKATLTITIEQKNPSIKLKAAVSPTDATDNSIVWKSSNKDVATVSSSGTVTATGVGTCTITATAGDGSGAKATCKITVNSDIVNKIEKGGLKYKLNHEKFTATLTGPSDKSIKKINIPATVKANGKTYKVTEIASKAFKGLKNLETVAIGKNVLKIGKDAFSSCKKLKELTIKTTNLTAKTVGKNAFKNVYKKIKVKCPKKKIKDYQKFLVKVGIPKTAKFTK